MRIEQKDIIRISEHRTVVISMCEDEFNKTVIVMGLTRSFRYGWGCGNRNTVAVYCMERKQAYFYSR